MAEALQDQRSNGSISISKLPFFEQTTCNNGLQMSAVRAEFAEESNFVSESTGGIFIGAMVSGNLFLELENNAGKSFTGPQAFCLNCNQPLISKHRIPASTSLAVVSLHLNEEFLDQLYASYKYSIPALLQAPKADPKFLSWSPDATITAMMKQIICCPYHEGPVRKFYLQGKMHELLALFIEKKLGPREEIPRTNLSSTNAERVLAVRDILIAEYSTPPTLDELSHRVGMSTSRMTNCFKCLFGMSITNFVQDYRMQQAYTELVEGQFSVKQVAFNAGYSLSYFSTLFRKKYGVSPTDIVNKYN